MTRRQLLALTATSALPLACKSSPPEQPGTIRKKGLCLSAKMRSPQTVADFLQSTGSHWIYNWNIDPPQILPDGIAFTPMIYKVGANLGAQLTRVKSNSHRELLGFNEPDAKSQGNTSVEAALNAWPMLEATGLRLGSPATVHPDNDWMIAFMKGVEERGLRVDFICMHSYGGPGAESLIRKIENVHALYKRPIWITEFAVADWKAETAEENRHKPERVAAFVADILPRLEAMEIVERYAWFHGGISGGPLASSKLFHPDGSLTAVGEAYRAAG